MRIVRDGVVAGLVAGAVSGLPSTLDGLVRTGRPLDASLAAGAILLPDERRTGRLLAAAVPVHFAISAWWGVVLAAVLPRRRPVLGGSAAGLGIAVLDLGLIGRRFPRMRQLPLVPQLVDHLVYGALVGTVLSRRRR
jgi:drug/metabolite transporter superfamily protein YnfA